MTETELKQRGGQYSCSGNWAEHVIVDGNLITGQNPGSSAGVAKAILKHKWLSNSPLTFKCNYTIFNNNNNICYKL